MLWGGLRSRGRRRGPLPHHGKPTLISVAYEVCERATGATLKSRFKLPATHELAVANSIGVIETRIL
jgi:hypothetical protein